MEALVDQPKNGETIGNFVLLDDEQIKSHIDYFKDTLTEVLATDPTRIGPVHSLFRNRLVDAISSGSPDLSDNDYFTLLQIGADQPFYFRTIGESYQPNDYNAAAVIYQGVNTRIQQDPKFADIFEEFSSQYYRHCLEHRHGMRTWESIIKRCRFTSIQDKDRSAELSTRKRQKQTWNQAANTIEALRDKSVYLRVSQKYLRDKLEKKGKRSFSSSEYFFSPMIMDKDTSVLMDISEQLEDGAGDEIFDFERFPDSLSIQASDTFRKLLKEAGENGWSNAKVLFDKWVETPKRDVDGYSFIIHLSNLVTKTLNNIPDSPFGDVKLTQLNPTQIDNVNEAIDRCMYAVFECGRQPDADPINFLVTADIIGKMFKSVSAVMKARAQSSGEED